MQKDDDRKDVQAIEALIARQFSSLSWTFGGTGDWDTFAADFFAEAALYPAARPAKRQSVPEFVERMKGLAGTKLRSFGQAVLGTEIRVFGNVAAAFAVIEITENGTEVNRGAEMLLLIKSEGVWQIASQAWDTERPSRRISSQLVGERGREAE